MAAAVSSMPKKVEVSTRPSTLASLVDADNLNGLAGQVRVRLESIR
jgi:hypothetical protein